MSKVKNSDQSLISQDYCTDYLEDNIGAGGSYSKNLHTQSAAMDYPQGSTQIEILSVEEGNSDVSHDHDDFIMSFYSDDNKSNS
jgi:hypothetical protein